MPLFSQKPYKLGRLVFQGSGLFYFLVGALSYLHYTDMHIFASAIIESGGEGVMLRNPTSVYKHGKSLSLLKYKVCLFVGFVALTRFHRHLLTLKH